MENIVINIAARQIREELLDDRPHWVAPCVLLREGVLNGSQGALYYPSEEIRDSAELWEGQPITVDHPMQNGRHVSAKCREMEDQTIGTVRNVTYSHGKLQAECWIDIEHCNCLSPQLAAKLAARVPVEISTGLFTTNVPAPRGSLYNGRIYHATARDYRPDHLALLPDSVGACSLYDGCGILANSGSRGKGLPLPEPAVKSTPERTLRPGEPLPLPQGAVSYRGQATPGGPTRSGRGPGLPLPHIDYKE